MKKAFGIILVTLLISTCLTCSAYAASASFKVTFTIPTVIGLNVPPYDTNKFFTGINNQLSETITEEILRDNQRIVLKTTVVK